MYSTPLFEIKLKQMSFQWLVIAGIWINMSEKLHRCWVFSECPSVISRVKHGDL